MLNWGLLRSPSNWIIITLMLLIGLMAYDAFARFYAAKFPSAPLQPPNAS